MLQLGVIALRNILKNSRRSFVIIITIALGFAAVSLFRGYTDYMFGNLRKIAIRGEGLGHLTLYHKGWFKRGKLEPENHMFSRDEVDKIMDIVKKDDDILLATPQLDIQGLVSNGGTTTIFLAKGVVPRDDEIIRGEFAQSQIKKGSALQNGKTEGIEMAVGLAEMLEISPNQTGVVMATTIDGQMNALDFDVVGIYDTGSTATNDKHLRVTYKFAQSLYETDKTDRIVVLLKDAREKTEQVCKRLGEKLTVAGIACDIRSWDQLSLFYKQVRGMFDLIFFCLFTIVFVIVLMSIVNTMATSVMERTREIGTLRALGLKRMGVNVLFGLEGAILGLFGSIGGVMVTFVVYGFISALKPTYAPPGVSTAVPLTVNLVPGAMSGFAVLIIFLSVFAAIWPARRAAGKNIVDALGHV